MAPKTHVQRIPQPRPDANLHIQTVTPQGGPRRPAPVLRDQYHAPPAKPKR